MTSDGCCDKADTSHCFTDTQGAAKIGLVVIMFGR